MLADKNRLLPTAWHFLYIDGLAAIFDVTMEECKCVRATPDSQPVMAHHANTFHEGWRPMTLVRLLFID